MNDQHTNRYITHFQDPLLFLYPFYIGSQFTFSLYFIGKLAIKCNVAVACTSIDVDDYFHLMKSLDYILRFNDNNSSQSNKAY